MSNKKYNYLQLSGEWKKHLRKLWKRKFWKAERQAGKKLIRKEK